jgi:molybdopterin converting factor small subunit
MFPAARSTRCSPIYKWPMVHVRIFGALWEHLEPSLELDLEGREVTVADLLDRLGIDPAEAGIVTVNRRLSARDGIIPADGRVCIFPPLSGG